MEYELKNCCISISDGDHLPPPKSDCGIPFITISNITNNQISFDNTLFVPIEYYEKLDDIRKAQPNDILYSVVGSYGKPVFIKDDRKFVFQRHIAILRPNCEVVDARYLYYIMTSQAFYLQADSVALGAAQRTISLSSLRNMKVEIQPLPTQRRIASILSAYDNLIENNNKRIRLLEQMAENLYKEWFVRFRFPGHEKVEMEESKIGKIPASFGVTNMKEVFDDYIGGGWGNEVQTDEFPISASVIRGADFPSVWRYDLSTCPKRYHKVSNYKSRQLQDCDIVLEISGGTSEQPVGRTVLVTQDMINRFEDGKVICASFCKLIRLKKDKVSPYYFYYWMHYLYDTRIIDRYQLQSTGIINFKFEAFLKKGILMLPPKDLMLSFEKQIIPLFKEINHLAMQNENLTRQRDLLLPRLMSGKLEVKE